MKTFAPILILDRALVSLPVRYALAVLLAGALGACTGTIDDAPRASAGAGAGPGTGAGAGTELGQVSVSLSVVPSDILCLRVSGAGPDRTVVRDLDIPAAAPITATLTGLPLGPVTFTAQAYGAACTGVTAATVADWASDPVTVSVALSHIASVELTLHRNGRAKVTIDFPDEPLCSPAGDACVTASTCCSRSCSKGICKDATDGGSDAASD